jgi:uncharacterized coiled-coil protein SlyX
VSKWDRLDWRDQELERRSNLQYYLIKMENMEFLKAILAEMNATQEKMDANIKAMQERMNKMKD